MKLRHSLLTVIAAISVSACQTMDTGSLYKRGEDHGIAVHLPKNAPSIGSDYSARTEYLGASRSMPHVGIDVLAPVGYPVLAAADGEVVGSYFYDEKRKQGYMVEILHDTPERLRTSYWHMYRSHVEIGQSVKRGDQIGDVGTTGLAHLHFMTYQTLPDNPHNFWLSGPGKISCFDSSKVQQGKGESILTYPVKCVVPK
jgi:murein DD-endopeptidase MepM/ murein hydrolase activator NlpD